MYNAIIVFDNDPLTLPTRSLTVLMQFPLSTAHTSGEVEAESDKLLNKIRFLYVLNMWVLRMLVSQSLIQF